MLKGMIAIKTPTQMILKTKNQSQMMSLRSHKTKCILLTSVNLLNNNTVAPTLKDLSEAINAKHYNRMTLQATCAMKP